MSGKTKEADVSEETEQVAVEVHPRAIRWMHWLNFPIISVMIWSGLRIYWSFDFTRVPGEFGDNNLIPNVVFEQLELDRKLAQGLSFHLSFGWLLVANGLAYILYLAFTKEWKHIVPRLADLKNIPATIFHDMGMKKEAPEHGQYNVMQQLAYTTVLIMAFILVVTGFALFKPTQLAWLVTIFGGYESARAIHFLMTAGLIGFFGLHIVQVIRAGFNNFWSMVTGYEVKDVAELEPTETTTSQSKKDAADDKELVDV